LGLFIVVFIPQTLAGWKNIEMSAIRATGLVTDRLGLSEEQSRTIAPITEVCLWGENLGRKLENRLMMKNYHTLKAKPLILKNLEQI